MAGNKTGEARPDGRGQLPVGEQRQGDTAKTFTIPGRLPSLNEHIDVERTNRYAAAKMKRDCETLVILAAKKGLRNWKAGGPVVIHYLWVEKDKRRDLDNISGYGHKIIQDSLVKAKFLPDDGQKWVVGFTDDFSVDKGRPRIEVTIEEILT